jgi:hypothetical protein
LSEIAFVPNCERVNKMAVAICFGVFVTALMIAMAVPRGDFVLVVGQPGVPEARIVQIVGRAEGSYVSGSAVSWIGIAYSNTPGFSARLLQSGAMLVLNNAFAVGCQDIKS